MDSSAARHMFAPISPDEMGAPDDRNSAPQEPSVIVPVPEDAPPMRFRHPRHGPPTQSWAYHDIRGRLLCQVARFDYIDDQGQPKKEILPLTFCEMPDGRRSWHAKCPPKLFPLYNLSEIAARPDAPILWVEGEKDAEGAKGLFADFVVTTTLGGANRAGESDYSLVAGRRLVGWPDNDAPGARYMQQVANICGESGAAEFRIVNLPEGLPPGWGLGDPLPDGLSLDTLRRLIEVPDQQSPGSEALQLDLPIEFSDEALALRYSDQHAGELRYVQAFGYWYEWDGQRWLRDATSRVVDLARSLCRAASAQALNTMDPKKADGIARRVASASTVSAVVRLARVDRRHARGPGDWDADPWVLNTPAGIVDLRTGQTMPHDPAAHCTKLTSVSPEGDCPEWLRFLGEVTRGDIGFQAYLARVIGYSLTGLTSEHALFFMNGPGGNGKGVFINTLTSILGDYSKVAPMDTFTATRSDRHPTDVAMLQGARLVAAQETDEGRHWQEAKIKAVTGGDPISARFMRQDFFTYTPQFKLFVVGNHRPTIRNVDDAMRRRLHLIPFEFKPDQPDRTLAERLKAEWPGIMAWAVRGCLEWQKVGLAPPPIVVEATAEYFEAEDAVGRWIVERCSKRPDAACETQQLFASWRAWAEERGEHSRSAKWFSSALDQRGYERFNHPVTRRSCFRGLLLL